jgi:hypothetical protein
MANAGDAANGLVEQAAAALPFAYRVFDELCVPLGTAALTALGCLLGVLWRNCKNIQGVRLWARRVALTKLDRDLDSAEDAVSSCYFLERHQRQLEASIVGLLISLSLFMACLFGCWLGRLHSGRSMMTDVLLAESGLMILVALGLFVLVGIAATECGSPSREEDEKSNNFVARTCGSWPS